MIFSAFDTVLSAEIEKRDDFDATTERETISIQNIDFFDVATDAVSDCFDVVDDVAKKVSRSEFFEITSEEIIDDVSINVDSLDDRDVANDVDTAFDAESDVDIAIIANIADANTTISFREIEESNDASLICCCNSVLCFLTRRSFNFSCSCESNF